MKDFLFFFAKKILGTVKMHKNLVIVESPAKAKTIGKFLGKDFVVKSSYGHIRDLKKSGMSINLDNNYEPIYEIPDDKKELVDDLIKEAKNAEIVWLASDEDREGEAIAWHLFNVLKLKKENTRRIVFHEITKTAIIHAIENPRDIDDNLVSAQQARRVLDRIVGFELSPVLWKKVRPSLSAGRVQSVTVRLIVDREKEIQNFVSESSFRIQAIFTVVDSKGKSSTLKAELPQRIKTEAEARAFLEKCKNAEFKVSDISVKPIKRGPAAPFITSTLQQEAARKLGFSVNMTMSLAQQLYEAGQITYMRTDSVNLSDLAINTAKKVISESMGEKYSQPRRFTAKAKGAQEAHEAIRPTYIENQTIEGNNNLQKLYDLVWKRTIASQMADAEIERTTVTIDCGDDTYKFVADGEVVKFDGFLKVYQESKENNEDSNTSVLPPLNKGMILSKPKEIDATERFTQHPPRYSEASLVHKLEELGIGRPSTYAPTISTIQNKEYAEKRDLEGKKRNYQTLVLKDNQITETTETETYGADRKKLVPTDTAIVVNEFLTEYFPDILDYNFTAKIENKFDDVAEGNMKWEDMIDDFYHNFHPLVEDASQISERKNGMRKLGVDPVSGKEVFVKIARFGAIAQIGATEDEEKPRFASLRKNQHLETITLEEALDLFKLPRTVGTYEDSELVVAVGRFGPYIKHNGQAYSLAKTYDPLTVTNEECIKIIEAKREEQKNKVINKFDDNGVEIEVLNGRFGPYIAKDGVNYKIAKGTDAKALTLDDCRKIIAEQADKAPAKKAKATKTTKASTKTATKTKASTKKSAEK